MSPRRNESELVLLRRLAEQLAAGRKERVTTAHLLAAIASQSNSASDLLLERRLDAERLLRAARASIDDEKDPLRRSIERAREVAARMGAREPEAVHLLIALVGERHSAAHRVLDQCGVDMGRLRVVAMNVGLGLVGRRRILTRRQINQEARERAVRPAKATTVPLVPPPALPRPRRTHEASSPGRPEPSVASVDSKLPIASKLRPLSPPHRRAQRPPRRSSRTTSVDNSRFALDPRAFPTLFALGKNLTLAAEAGQLEPVVGRDVEIEQALDVLAKREGNNPCLVGLAGVGKTSIVRGLAQRIASAEDVGSLDDKIVIEIPITEFVAGTGVRGALAQRLAAIRKEVLASAGRVVLFFDEIHQLFVGDGAEEIVGDLKVALARGELPCIGATTHDDYAKSIDCDAALARRFSRVEVVELNRDDAFLVLDALAPAYERHHGVAYGEASLACAVGWSVRYLPGRALPDKAISIIDLAGARTRRRGGRVVGPEQVAEVVAEMADLPVERLLETDRERMLRLEELLADRVVGHSEQLLRIARILRRNAAGLVSRRPIGTFLLLGPTGVGKTETAKAIAEALFFNESAMTRLDLSEYSEAHATARLIGAPPGYVGHEAGGQLTEAVRRRPYQVILLDEIEKAHSDVLEAFLAVFDEGRLTDGRGRTVDFTNTVILLTSNIGADVSGASSRRRVGFGHEGASRSETDQAVVAAARGVLAPELYNRIDEVLVYAPLDKQEVREIAVRLLTRMGAVLETERRLRLVFDSEVVDFLLEAGGFDVSLGARPMKRMLARWIEAPLAEMILRGELVAGDCARLEVRERQIAIRVDCSRSVSAAE